MTKCEVKMAGYWPSSFFSAGHRHFCLYGFLQHDWSRQNQNKEIWPRGTGSSQTLCTEMWTAAILQRSNITVKNTGKCNEKQHLFLDFVRQGSLMFYFSISTDINSPFSHSAKVVRTLSSTASSVILAWFFNFSSCRNVCSFTGLFISLELFVCVWTNSNRRFAIDNA